MATPAALANFKTHSNKPTPLPTLSMVGILNQRLPEVKVSKVRREAIMASFVPKRGITKNTKTCVIPAEIQVGEELAAAIGLYLGDGDKGNRLKFSNCNLEIVEYFLRYLLRLGVQKCDLRIRLCLNENSENDLQIRERLKAMLDLPESRIFIRRGRRFAKPVIEIKVEGTLFAKIWKAIEEEAMSIIVSNPVLRRSFLQGAFAADGGISWDNSQRKKVLQKVSFSFNAETEKEFRDILIECLRRENIPLQVREVGPDGRIFIRGYAGFTTLYDLGVLDLHKERLQKFYDAIKLVDIFVHLDNTGMEKLFGLESQRKIAALVGSYHQNISKVLRGKRRLRIEWMIKLCLVKGISFADIITHIKGISFKSSAIWNPSPNLLRTIFELRREVVIQGHDNK
jgi:hypothetical protein